MSRWVAVVDALENRKERQRDEQRRKLGKRDRLVEAHRRGRRADLLRLREDAGDPRPRRGAPADGRSQGGKRAQTPAVGRDCGAGGEPLGLLRGAYGRA